MEEDSVPGGKPGDLLTCGHLAAEPWAFSQRWMHVKPKMCPQRSADSRCSPAVVQASKQMLQESPSPSSQRGGGVRAWAVRGGCSSTRQRCAVMNGEGDRDTRLMGQGRQSDPDHSGDLWENEWIHLNNCLKMIGAFPASVGKEGRTHPQDLTQNKTDMHTCSSRAGKCYFRAVLTTVYLN